METFCNDLIHFFIFIINGILSLLTTFGPAEAAKQRFPLFTQWRLVSISSFVEHLDFYPCINGLVMLRF